MSRLASLLVLVLLAAACGGGGSSSASLAPLNGEWRLTSGTGPAGDVELDGGPEVTLTIDGDEWGGQVCNHYGAEGVEVGDGSVSMTGVMSTEMACLEPGWMEAEAAYLDAFRQVDAYEVTSDELVLTGDGVELRYEPVAADEPAALVGTLWVLDTLIEGSDADGTASSTFGDEPATLEFLEDGGIVASSGCITREDGTYEIDGSQLRTRFESAYDYDCEGDQLRAQDTHVWQVLGDDPTFEIDGHRLTLTAGELGSGYLAGDAGQGEEADPGTDQANDGQSRDEPETPTELDDPQTTTTDGRGVTGTSGSSAEPYGPGVSCDAGGGPEPAPDAPTEAVAHPSGVTGQERYDALDVELGFPSTTVPSGCEVTARMRLTNRSGETVVEQACELGTGRRALVPMDDPDAELWMQPIADCGGDREILDGHEGDNGTVGFLASTRTGEALRPGEYLAVLEFDGWSGRFEQPVTVTAAP